MKRFKLIIIALLVVAIIVPTQIALVSSSYGYVRINSKTESAIGQQVNAGGNVNLYFGGLTWSGSQFYLLLSHDLSTQVSFGDYIYTPRFSVANLINPNTKTNYSNDDGGYWTVGDNWVNGSFAWAASGSYSVKAFDDVSENVAVTDTYIIIDTEAFPTSFQISPSSGPGGINALFTGSGYSGLTAIDVAYYDQTYYEWRLWKQVTTNQSGGFSFTSTIPDLGRSNYYGEFSEIVTRLQFRTQSQPPAGLVYSYANYDQYARGLKQVGSQTATHLYGDCTNFTQTLNVKVGDNLQLKGAWFHPGVVYIRWDGVAVIGTVSSDQWLNASIIGTTIAGASGSFDKIVTIPQADAGNHYLAIEDGQTILRIQLQVIPSPTPSPTYSPSPSASPAPTQTPTPTPTPSPNKPTPTITVTCKSTAIANGFRVEINGIITGNGTELASKPVQLHYSNNGGANWESLTRVNSASDGKFSAVWISPASGNFVLKAVSEANSEYNQATTQVNFVISETPDKNVLSVTSNSTITEFKFDSAENKVSFKAEGSSNTNGYVAINVPKTLVADVSNLKVYLDGSEVTFNSELQIDTWVITIYYSHSVHTIVMDLSGSGASNVDNEPSELPTYIIAIAIAAIVITAILAVAVLKKKQKTHS